MHTLEATDDKLDGFHRENSLLSCFFEKFRLKNRQKIARYNPTEKKSEIPASKVNIPRKPIVLLLHGSRVLFALMSRKPPQLTKIFQNLPLS